MKKTLIFLLVSVLALSSCKKDKNEPGEDEPGKEVEVKKTLVNVTLMEDDEVLSDTKVYLFDSDEDPTHFTFKPFHAKNEATTDEKGKVQFNLDEYIDENEEKSFYVAVFNDDILIKSTLFSIKKEKIVDTEISYSIPNPLLGKWKLVKLNQKDLDKCQKESYVEFRKKEYDKIDGFMSVTSYDCTGMTSKGNRYKVNEDKVATEGGSNLFTFSISGDKLTLSYNHGRETVAVYEKE